MFIKAKDEGQKKNICSSTEILILLLNASSQPIKLITIDPKVYPSTGMSNDPFFIVVFWP
ncbi:hypothetical protein GLOIN_2v1690296 [Rhizophagus irregularis DAOM 181602=DAOM 197198]|uniref:Uncharacterized protein n=1 Tax=Rhizophagus irregularis (strain DAOM 181602 / DAOM 197198 / MUCL 43194) TaxID=747089 RepID=A0A2P4PCE1_RHIID|nr:hypothetical protein GLOIN_2v1690296 [Rhizophagus irregularis DAOM 181602=DAOM 197198]POG63040.1 hypothetical protein GLOIN_2v1690296 [Rhizophagus irregularis DAOM 181602=DAOM 197198]|eukprot:XP_025169906.1 hypothetical protein GLOIN_2v1690296 [Rhizophagus irregularis DAOM 181602=DAOM 197198]